MTRSEAIAKAEREFPQYTIYIRKNEVIIRDNDSKLISKIPYNSESQQELF